MSNGALNNPSGGWFCRPDRGRDALRAVNTFPSQTLRPGGKDLPNSLKIKGDLKIYVPCVQNHKSDDDALRTGMCTDV